MALFRRKKEAIPAEEFTLPEPPELPSYEMNKKEANFDNLKELPVLDSFEESNFEEKGENMPPVRIEMDQHTPPQEMDMQVMNRSPKNFVSASEKPIFVKLDKFKESINHLGKIKDKLKNASSILNRINEIRNKEDNELQAWERDLEDLKEKLEGIDKKLFSDVE